MYYLFNRQDQEKVMEAAESFQMEKVRKNEHKTNFRIKLLVLFAD